MDDGRVIVNTHLRNRLLDREARDRRAAAEQDGTVVNLFAVRRHGPFVHALADEERLEG